MPRKSLTEVVADKAGIPVDELPRRYEILGKAMVMNFIPISDEIKYRVAKSYVSKLKLWSFYEINNIEGDMRIPKTRLIYGINTDIFHKENGIIYQMNPSKVMFSKGNKYERHRLTDLVSSQEVIVDMFAGIGYYSIPLAKKVMSVYACEINPESFHYLLLNKRINNAERLIPYFGDSGEFPFEGIADRVIMGHFYSLNYINKAIDILKKKGIIHLHLLIKRGDNSIYSHLEKEPYVSNIQSRIVKSYSPSLNHMVFDISIEKK